MARAETARPRARGGAGIHVLARGPALAALCALGLLTGCAATERAATLSAEAVNRYCHLSPEARTLARDKIEPYLEPGVSIAVECP